MHPQTWTALSIAGPDFYSISRTTDGRATLIEAFPNSRLATPAARPATLRPVIPLAPRRL